MVEIDKLRESLTHQLDQAIGWFEGSDRNRETTDGDAAEQLALLKARATSVLLRIALLGAFSSGKSFLANGLQGFLQYKEIEDDGEIQPKFIGILPSLPVSTTAVPTTLQPVHEGAAKKDDDLDSPLRVRLMGNERWTEVGVSSPGRIRAYTTSHPNYIGERKSKHVEREVAEAEIDLHEPALRALIYDLPGTNSPNPTHDAIVRRRVQDADCFVYVTMATSSLSESDLELIRFMFEHHRETSKPVIWVVTGIDLANQLGPDDEPAWKTTLAENNHYLRENFEQAVSDASGTTFVGSGFAGVSPALEARAQAAEDPARSERLLARSGMRELRSRIEELIEGESGRGHLHRIALEALAVVHGHHGRLEAELNSQRIPHEQLESEIAQTKSEISATRKQGADLRAILEDHLGDAIRRTAAPFDKGTGLKGHLKTELASVIDTTNFLKEDEINRYELKLQEATSAWLKRKGNPGQLWEREVRDFRRTANRELSARVGDATVGRKSARINLNDLDQLLQIAEAAPPDPQTAERLLKFAKDVSPYASAGLAAAGVTTAVAAPVAAMALLPAAAAVGIASIFTFRRNRTDKITAQEALRRVERERLSDIAEHVAQWFMAQASANGFAIVDAADDRMQARIADLDSHRRKLVSRSKRPEQRESKAHVDYLEDRHSAGQDIIDALADIAHVTES
ncbi:MAG: dynamin family protein [Actinomycetota bacterium]